MVVGNTACGLLLNSCVVDEVVVAKMIVAGRVNVVDVSVEVMAVSRGSLSGNSVLMQWGCVVVAAAWMSWAFWVRSRVLP